MDTGQSKPRSISQRIFGAALAFSLSFLFLCATAEIGLRVSGDRQAAIETGLSELPAPWVDLLKAEIYESVPDPVRRYAMRPGASTAIADEVTGQTWTFQVNSHRARGPEFPLVKPENERRILCLGDSFAFGLWCNQDETLVGHLAKLANQNESDPNISWRGISIGVPGYHTGQQRIAFEQDGLAMDPDVVVLYFNTNDIMQDGFFYDDDLNIIRVDLADLPSDLRRGLWSSHLYGFLTRTLLTEAVKRIQSPHLDPRVPYAHVRADNQAYCRSELERIATICRERNLPLFVVNQPLMTWSDSARGTQWNILPLYDWARTTFDELGLPQLGLLGWMRGYADGIDRIATLGPSESAPEPDFRPDFFFADPAVQRWVKAFKAGRTPAAEDLPKDPDFHLLGDGYGSMANLVYSSMQSIQMLP
ncbi:MAG: lysophospholipase L1-like esterase [Planctomycetota bacterium]|jgi:lysophospholipase L1-like esterase